jgi:hypothetical protein
MPASFALACGCAFAPGRLNLCATAWQTAILGGMLEDQHTLASAALRPTLIESFHAHWKANGIDASRLRQWARQRRAYTIVGPEGTRIGASRAGR